MNVENYKCLSCGAPLVFDDSTGQLLCHSCDNTYTIDQFEDFDSFNSDENIEREIHWNAPNVESYTDENTTSKVFMCPSCGAEIVGDENTVSTKCPYCDNPSVVSDNVSGMLKPDFIIPFKISKDKAKESLKKFYKGKLFLPKEFVQENRIDSIQGMYVPFWLFDCDGDAAITYSGQIIRTWSDSNYRYTKTSHYAIFRQGSLSFRRVPVDAASKLEDNYMDALEPFYEEGFEPFDGAYMAGFLADKYDVSAEDCMPRAKERITNSIKHIFLNTVHGYTNVYTKNSNIQMSGGKVQYGLLPVWILNTKYKGKLYKFAINGQTGKVVGELPCSLPKMLITGLISAATTFGIAQLISLFLI